MGRVFVVTILSLFILAGCNTASKKYVKPYFDFDSLVQAQQHLLKSSGASVTKQATVNDRHETVTFTPDTTQWKNELEIFAQLDVVNKPMYKTAYRISHGLKDPNSNLIVKEYRATVPSPIPYVLFYYQPDTRQLRKIAGRLEETNALFSSVRVVTLEFDELQGHTALEKYTLHGVQKMIMTDSTVFDIEGKINVSSH
jgi:hypothetical protein